MTERFNYTETTFHPKNSPYLQTTECCFSGFWNHKLKPLCKYLFIPDVAAKKKKKKMK